MSCLLWGHNALASPWPEHLSQLRTQIEITPFQDHEPVLQLARQGLAEATETSAKLFFLDRMTVEQTRLRRWADLQQSSQDALALAGADPLMQVRFATQLGYALQAQGQSSQALLSFDQRIAPHLPGLLAASERLPRQRAADALRMRGSVLLNLGRKPEAMEQLISTLRVYDALEDAEGRALTLHAIAATRFAAADLAEALKAQQQAIQIAEAAEVTGVLARMYLLLSYFHAQQGPEEAMLNALQSAQAHAHLEGDEFALSMVHFNLGDVALKHQRWDEALNWSDIALRGFQRVGDDNMTELCQANRGIALNRLGRPGGIALLRHAVATLSSDPSHSATVVAIKKALASELAIRHEFEQAYLVQVDLQRDRDALHQADNQQRIAVAEAAYQADRRQRQIEELEHEQAQQRRTRWLWILVAGLGLTVAVVTAISRFYLKRAYRKMEDMALEDPLTGLHNRRYLSMRLAEDMPRPRRRPSSGQRQRRNIDNHPPALSAFLIIDMDHFKSVNDVFGHAAGDAVLRQTAAVLRDTVRASDTVVRWGGEEFLVYAKGQARHEMAELAERIRVRIAATRFEVGPAQILSRTCSIGFAAYVAADATHDGPSWESLVALADECLYAAKAHGRDQWVGLLPGPVAAPWPESADAASTIAQGLLELVHRPGPPLPWPTPTTLTTPH